jgi:8-oxo-dGTP pyrophosphatase MutT (NUDIX family)
MLKNKINFKKEYQKVAGFIVFRRTEEGIKFLLLYKGGTYWNFPKGHFESGETGLETALRETYEETGLKKSDLKIIPEFRAYEKFSFPSGNQIIYKNLILYLAETNKEEIKIAPREHFGFGWFLYRDAIKIIGKKYSGVKKVLKQAENFIKKYYS